MKSRMMMAPILILTLTLALALALAAPASAQLRFDDGVVGCSWSDDCFPFDLTTYVAGAPLSVLPEGDYPYDATMNPAGTEVWIVGASGDGVVVYDLQTKLITHRIDTGDYSISVAFSNDGETALVTSRDEELACIVKTTTYAVTDTLPLPCSYQGPGNVALDPGSGNFYVVNWYYTDLFEVAPDGSAILNQVPLGNNLWQIVVSPDGQYIYVTDRGTDEVRVIDQATLTQVHSVPVGDDPWGIDITGDGGKLVVVCEDDSSVHVIDTTTWAVTVLALTAGADPRDVDILDSNQKAYVTGGRVGTTSNPVYIIDLATDTIETSFEAPGSNPNVIAAQAQMHTDLSEVVSGPVPGTIVELAACPNPFNPQTVVSYVLGTAADIELVVYDLAGRRVKALTEGWREAGTHTVTWDGRSDAGHRQSSGIYCLRLRAGVQWRTYNLVLLK